MRERKESIRCRWCGGRVGQQYYQVEGRCYCGWCMELFRKCKEE